MLYLACSCLHLPLKFLCVTATNRKNNNYSILKLPQDLSEYRGSSWCFSSKFYRIYCIVSTQFEDRVSSFIREHVITSFAFSWQESQVQVVTAIVFVGNYILNYVASQPKLAPFAIQALIQVIAKLTKLGWFEVQKDEFVFRDIIADVKKFLQVRRHWLSLCYSVTTCLVV